MGGEEGATEHSNEKTVCANSRKQIHKTVIGGHGLRERGWPPANTITFHDH